MCEEKSCCCTNPEKLKDKPETCTPEQISKCHPNSDGHPCGEKKEESQQT